MDTVLWRARKRTLFGLPLSFTVYTLTETKLFIKTGFFNIREEERIFGLGTIHCCTADQTAPELDIKRIKNCKEIRTLLSDRVEEERSERYVGVREFMGDDGEADAETDGH